MSGSGVALSCEGLVQIYRIGDSQVAALRGIDLIVGAGEQVALMGPSGSGKSTLLGLLAGVLRPSAGRLTLDGVDTVRTDDASLRRLRASRVGTLLQGAPRNLLGHLDAVQNIGFARRAAPPQTRRRLPAPMELLDAVGLADVARTPIARLSGGEQQRAALAAAIANGPGLVLADEPTSELDTTARDQVLDLMRRTTASTGGTLVLVTHDPAVAAQLPRSIVLRDGRVVADSEQGDPTSVVTEDGQVPLPAALADEWPAGTRVSFHRDGDSLRLTKEDT